MWFTLRKIPLTRPETAHNGRDLKCKFSSLVIWHLSGKFSCSHSPTHPWTHAFPVSRLIRRTVLFTYQTLLSKATYNRGSRSSQCLERLGLRFLLEAPVVTSLCRPQHLNHWPSSPVSQPAETHTGVTKTDRATQTISSAEIIMHLCNEKRPHCKTCPSTKHRDIKNIDKHFNSVSACMMFRLSRVSFEV